MCMKLCTLFRSLLFHKMFVNFRCAHVGDALLSGASVTRTTETKAETLNVLKTNGPTSSAATASVLVHVEQVGPGKV